VESVNHSMDKQFGPMWVIAETVEGKIRVVSMQLIGHGRKLADELSTSLEVVLLGNELEGLTHSLFAAGADRIYLGDDHDLVMYQPEIYTEIIVNLAEERKPEAILIGSTSMGRELAPLVAATLETGLTAHCIDLVHDKDKNLEGIVPAYGGLLSIICPEQRPQIATVARGVFTSPELDENKTGEVIPLSIPKKVPRRIQILDVVHEEPEVCILIRHLSSLLVELVLETLMGGIRYQLWRRCSTLP
jgi:electron transfer flavoprotein alpha subunit